MALILIANVASYGTTYSTVQHASNPGGLYSGSLFQNGDIYNADVYIDANTKVVITSKTINMGSKTTIHVMPTAMLVLDGTTITGTFTSWTGTNGWWNGIEVQGTPSKHQPTIANVKSGFYISSSGSTYYNQGVVWIHDHSGTQSVIEYSKWGVYAGRMPVFGGTALGGGVIICENSSFTNNFVYSVYFDDVTYSYPYGNLSYVTGCTFSFDGSHGVRTGNNGFITAFFNVFEPTYPVTASFSQNSFTVTGSTYTSSIYGSNWAGIWTEGCAYSTESNQFYNLFAGIYDNSIGWGHIHNGNYGNSMYYGIVENGGPTTYFNYNSFQLLGGAYSTSVANATGIYINGAALYTAQSNFLQASSAQSSSINAYGFYVKNTGSYGSLINFNIAHAITSGISAESNNSGTMLRCNDLSDVFPLFCVAVTSGNIAKVQGTKNAPAGNQFSNQTLVSNEDFSRYSGTYLGASNITYYFNASIHSNANPTFATSNINKQTTTSTTTCGIINHGYISDGIAISSINSDIAGLPVPPAGTTDQQNQYAEDILQKQNYIGAAVSDLLIFDTVSSTPDTLELKKNVQKAINFVKTQGNQVDTFLLINLYIDKQTYDTASSLITTLSAAHSTDAEITNYCSFYNIYIAGLENSFNTTWQGDDTATLKTIAGTNTMASASAQSLLQHLADRRVMSDTTDTAKGFTVLYPPTFETIGGGSAPEQVSGIRAPVSTALLSITAWPDPVTDNLQLEITNPTDMNTSLHVVVLDNLGRTVIDRVLSAGANSNVTSQLNLSAFAKGMYYLTVTDNLTILHKQSIVKQ